MPLGEVPWPCLTCRLRTATAWGSYGIFVPSSGNHQSDASDADDGAPNRAYAVLKSACLQCERVAARAFAICQISSLFIGSLGGLRFRGLLALLS